ncbi:MAG: cold shock domain-containing protein [bacterium]|nr:cold shock domain-containing protein [bacterium]
MEGIIKKLTDKGFGFITVDGEEKDLFFHGNELKGVKFEELKEGDRLSFDKTDSPKGPNATNVTRI